ncbi:MAG: hypothetical protein UT61_C0006G0001 [Candidatus Woesebacteria bacterium GW2011_GWA1_39_8]|uniref:Purine nucleoside phosphorylase n=1 Tax=Candidatus Woesebacteria bacterium GW2011_GWA1_39_8 TaxID=1618552 RepID=A0A0G0S6T2_9BACT|nr:MAG: hypothetical protein UT61_C0006G0001 [Candidatus Woesebacteria bacterium GW2011_GWA1_39_8]
MYQIPELLKFPKLFHAFSTKDDGDLSANFDLESKTVQRRGKFLGKLKLKLDDCIKMQVAHDDEIVEANEELKGISLRDWKKSVNVDGLVTNRNGIFLFLLIADCLPIIFYDPLNKAVGLIHAGWKGADLNIVGKAIKKTTDKTNTAKYLCKFLTKNILSTPTNITVLFVSEITLAIR